MRKTDLKTKRLYEITKRQTVDDSSVIKYDAHGYRVVIPGFEEFTFFVHRSIETLSESLWRISEVTTGFALPPEIDGLTRQEAIDNATTFLVEKGKSKFVKAMAKAQAILEAGVL